MASLSKLGTGTMHPIITMLDGTEVYVNLINSGVALSVARQPRLIGLVKEALEKTTLTEQEVQIEQDMGRIVGYDFVVTTKEDDNIFYAKILRENTYTRFIKNGKPLQTQYVTLTLRHTTGGRAYELNAVRIGRLIPPRPGMPDDTSESRSYWKKHAFVHESETLQISTISKECPY